MNDSHLAPELLNTLYQGDLEKFEQAVIAIGDSNDNLINLAREIERKSNNTDFQCHARRISWREGTLTKSAIIVQMTLIRARRSLYVSTSPKIRPLVCEHLENSTVRQIAESPKLLMRQIGSIASMSSRCLPPPLSTLSVA